MDPCDLRLAKGDEAVARPGRAPHAALRVRAAPDRRPATTWTPPTGRAAALDEAAPVVAGIKNSSIQHEVAVQLAGMLGILDTQFVVRRVAQLARWARDRGGDGGPAPAAVRSAAAGPRPHAAGPARRPARAARRSTSAAPPTASSASCSSSPCSGPTWSPRPSTPTGPTSSPPRRTPRCASAIAEAGGAEPAPDDSDVSGPGPRRRPRRHGARAWSPSSPSSPCHAQDPDEAYAGEQLVAVRLPRRRPPRSARSRAPCTRLGARARPRPPGRRAERALGPPAVRPVPARTAAPARPVRARLPGRPSAGASA